MTCFDLIRTVFRSVFRWARSSGGAWRAYHPGQRERQENPKAKINLFIVTNPTIGKTLSKDTIFGIARKSRTGSQSWYHTNSGRTIMIQFLDLLAFLGTCFGTFGALLRHKIIRITLSIDSIFWIVKRSKPGTSLGVTKAQLGLLILSPA